MHKDAENKRLTFCRKVVRDRLVNVLDSGAPQSKVNGCRDRLYMAVYEGSVNQGVEEHKENT